MQEQQQQQQKKSTDLICFFIFLAISAFFIISTSYSLVNGDPDKLGLPKDSDHKICGYDNVDYKFIYFTTPQNKFLFRTVCVSECPNSQQITTLKCSPNSLVKSCSINPSVQNIEKSVLAYSSQPYNSQVCLPDNEDYFNEIKSLVIPQNDQLFGSELHHFKWIILAISLISLFLSLLILLFVEKYSSKIIWICIACILICLFTNCFLCSKIYYSDNKQTHVEEIQQQYLQKQIYFGSMIISISLIALIVVYAIYIKQEMNILVNFLKIGGDFIKSNWAVLLTPLIGSVMILVFSFFWIQQQLYQLSAVAQVESRYPYDQTNFDSFSQFMIYFNAGTYLWILLFIIGTVEYIISGMVCEWYYQQGTKANSQKQNIISDLVKNHIGSIALGSLLIGIFSPIKIIFKLLPICPSFYNKIIFAINKNCYVVLNIYPNHFLECGIVVRDLAIKEVDFYSKIGEMGQTFINIIRLFFGFLCQIICFIVLIDQSFAILISIYSFVVGYTIASVFMSIYGQSSEAIFMLYLYNKYHMDPEDNPQSTITLQQVLNQISENQIQ